MLGVKLVIVGTLETQTIEAVHPALVTELSERNWKVKDPSAAVDNIEPGEVVPDQAFAGQVCARNPGALPDGIKVPADEVPL